MLSLELDKEFLVSPKSISASIGERIRLRCQPPDGSPMPVVYWTKNGKNLSVPLDRYDLVLSSIKQSDFGSYRCIASNGLVRQSSLAYLTEFHRPNITIQPSSSRIDLYRGQSIHLKCHIDNDQYKIEWHFKNKITQTNDIYISSIEYNQSGIYTCVGCFEEFSFNKQILVAVYDRQIFNGREKVFSQSNVTVFVGRSAIIDCQLPFNSKQKISWTIVNRSKIDDRKLTYVDKNQYRLKIHRIKEFYNNTLFQCSYQDKNIPSQGLIQLNVKQSTSPPIISFLPNNQTVLIGVQVILLCQSNDKTHHIQWWFIPDNYPYKTIKINNNQKYEIKINQGLIIQHVDK